MFWKLRPSDLPGLVLGMFTQLSVPAYGMPLAIGDSIAECIADAGADRTDPPATKIGASPQWVLDTIRDLGDVVKDTDIILSPGWANIPNTPKTFQLEIDELKRNGARKITVVGINGSPLAGLAAKAGVSFQGFKAGQDHVHPENCTTVFKAITALPTAAVVKPVTLPPAPVVIPPTAAPVVDAALPDPDPLLVPIKARPYQRSVIREARLQWGLNAPVSMIGAQLQTESAWNATAHSAYAGGLAQFIPATAAQMAREYPQTLGSGDVLDPEWSIRAMNQYDHDLYKLVKGSATECDHYAFTLSAYNGGYGWISRDKAYCQEEAGCDPSRWFGNVANWSHRAAQFKTENRNYETRILLDYQPSYRAWGGYVSCQR